MLRRSLVVSPVFALAALAALAGCPGGGDDAGPAPDAGVDAPIEPCAAGFLGDRDKDPVIELRALRADGSDVTLNDGDDLAIILPPQGGRVAFVGVRATNIDGCGVQITGALRDPVSKQVRVDGRTVNLTKEADGWGTTGQGHVDDFMHSATIGDYSNIPLCPNQWASQDVFDQPFQLEVVVQDRRKKQATATITVTPRCSEPGAKEAGCKCLCKNGYVLGESCGEDAGSAEAGTL